MRKRNLESGVGTYTYNLEHNIKIDKSKQEFLDDLKNGVKITTFYSIYSPEEGGNAYGTIIKPPEGGTLVKIYGNKFPYKGHSPRVLVYGMQMPKYMLSAFLRGTIAKSPFYVAAIICQFLFLRKQFRQNIEDNFREFNERIDWFYKIPATKDELLTEKDYNGVELEVMRAIREAIRGTRWEKAGEEVAKYIGRFLFSDPTYRIRGQDALGEGKDLWGTLEILIQREKSGAQAPKWKFIKLGLRILLFLSPELRKISNKFFCILDRNKVQLDEADRYWGLKFRDYDLCGMTKEERYAERKRLDEENHTVFML